MVEMSQVQLRPPADRDWPEILRLAHASLGEMSAVPSQQSWLDNRKSFSQSGGIQYHFVASSGDRIIGYACAEHHARAADGEFRLFVVVEPADRETLGTKLFDRLSEQLPHLGATYVWVLEYKTDVKFLQWWRERGFEFLKEFVLDDGTPVVELKQNLARTDEVDPSIKTG